LEGIVGLGLNSKVTFTEKDTGSIGSVKGKTDQDEKRDQCGEAAEKRGEHWGKF